MTVRRIGSGGPWEDVVGYSRVVVAGDSAWVSGCTATVDGEVVHPGDMVIMISYGVMDETEAKAYIPRVVHVDGANRIVELGGDPSAPVPGATDQQRSDLGVPVRR